MRLPYLYNRTHIHGDNIFIWKWPSRFIGLVIPLQQRHNEHSGISNHQPHSCLLNCLFSRRSRKTSKLRVTGFCEGNSLVTSESPAQRASKGENVSIWWRLHSLLPEAPNNITNSTPTPNPCSVHKISARLINCKTHLWTNKIAIPLMVV